MITMLACTECYKLYEPATYLEDACEKCGAELVTVMVIIDDSEEVQNE